MIDIKYEKPLSFPAIKKLHPAHPSLATIWRWSLKGLRGVRLETIKVGGRRYTTLEAIDRFSARLTDLQTPDKAGTPKRRYDELSLAARQADHVFGGSALTESRRTHGASTHTPTSDAKSGSQAPPKQRDS